MDLIEKASKLGKATPGPNGQVCIKTEGRKVYIVSTKAELARLCGKYSDKGSLAITEAELEMICQMSREDAAELLEILWALRSVLGPETPVEKMRIKL